jgi:hypothetical protein
VQAAQSLLEFARKRFDWQAPQRPPPEPAQGSGDDAALSADDMASAIAQLRLSGALGDDDDMPTFVV